MQNWGAVTKTMTAQMNATGSATEELNRKMNSLEGRVNKMTNSFSKFWNSAINSLFIKTAISGITTLTDVLTTLNSSTQGLLVPTAILIGLLVKFKDIQIVQTFLAWSAGLIGFSTAEGVATVSTIGLTVSLKALQMAIPIVGAVMLVLGLAVNKYQEYTAQATEETEKFKTAQSELNAELSKGDENTKAKVVQIEALIKKYDELTKKQKESNVTYDERGGRHYTEDYNKTAQEIKNIEAEFKKLGLTADEAQKKIELGRRALAETAKQAKITTETMEHLSGRLTEMSDKYSLLKNAQEELNDQGYLSQGTIDAINEKYGKFIDVTKLSSSAIINFVNTEKKAIEQSINNNIAETNAEIKNRKDKIANIKTEIQALGLLAQAKGHAGVVAMYDQYAKSRALEGILKEIDQLENKNAVLKNSLKEIKGIESRSDEKSKSGKDNSKTQSAEESYAVVEKDRYSQLNLAIKNLNNELERNKAIQENTTDLEAKNKLHNEEIELYKKKQQAIASLAKEQRVERDELIKTLKVSGAKFTGSGDSALFENYQEMRNKLIDSMNLRRNDKNKTVYNQLKAQLEELDKQFTRFAELQTDLIPKARLEWTELKGSINGVTKSIKDEAINATQELVKQVSDALESQDEQLTKSRIEQMKERMNLVDKEIEQLEEKYKSAEDKIDRDELVEKIASLNREKAMRSIEGSLDASARIYEIDKELIDLNKELAGKDRKTQYEQDKKVLENKKNSIQDEVDAEERALEERKRNLVYFQRAREMIEKQSMDNIVSLLKTFDSQFALDGQTKGQMWLDSFKAKVLQASSYLTSIPNASSNISSSGVGSIVGGNQASPTLDKKYSSGSAQAAYEYIKDPNTSASDRAKAQDWLDKFGGKYEIHHEGIDSGLAGGLPMPKNWEVVAKLAKGEPVFNVPQMNNLSTAINAMLPKPQTASSSGIINNFSINATVRSDSDIDNMSKSIARTIEKQMYRRGVRV